MLLEKTEGKFEALLGTLLTARKYKVYLLYYGLLQNLLQSYLKYYLQIIHFDGEVLLKGVNDDTSIVLWKEEI